MNDDALWYKDAIIYELRVRAFFDSDGDGIGDFRGLAQRLDYLQDLGVDTLWLLPFYPSPLKDDGYDISDYSSVHPHCGTLQDFKYFVREAHRRNLRVVTELVLNHTSDQHPWFQRARRAQPGSRYRDWYVWSDDPERYKEARIIFKDFETSNWAWDPVAKAYFWHRFYSNQPDLNFDSPAVRRAMLQVVDFWFGLGVDGMRLDAVPYLYEREGTNCENLPETHAFLRSLRRHVDQKFKHRMLLAEANQWPEDAVAYFGDDDECHMSFHFPIMPRLFMALHMEDRYPVVDILQQTPELAPKSQWALFLRNHDELTLEMVTDEERDYMYRVYAHDQEARINLGIRRRLAPLLGNDRRRIELLNGLLCSLPGTPVLYYGDEIGMGDNFYLGDRSGVRTPMQWSADRNAGFSRANPQRLYLPVIIDPEYNYETVNVEAQQQNPHSLLWWMKRLIALRQRFRAFGRGRLEFLDPRNRRVLAFIREYGDERILVVANLSRFVQYVELDLGRFKDWVAVELFGMSEFPPIGELPYLLTLGPHAFYWLALVPQRGEPVAEGLATIEVESTWEELFDGEGRETLAHALPGYLRPRRWFGGKARHIQRASIVDAIPLRGGGATHYLTVIELEYTAGTPDRYLVPIGFAVGEEARAMQQHSPHHIVARVHAARNDGAPEGVLYDGLASTRFAADLLGLIGKRRRVRGSDGHVTAKTSRAFKALQPPDPAQLEPQAAYREQSNSSVTYGDRFILKLFRRPDRGVNPDLEVGRFLTERTNFGHIAPVAGWIEHELERQKEPTTLAVLHGFVPNEGDAWQYTLDEIERYFERAIIAHREHPEAPVSQGTLLELTQQSPHAAAITLMGGYLETARLLGRRTGEMHLALASDNEDPAFAPESFSRLYQRSLYQSMRNLCGNVFHLIRDRLPSLPTGVAADAEHVLGLEQHVLKMFRTLADRRIRAKRIRCHGDYHLGQILYTGRDFVIIDFEGEPARTVGERRIKRSAFRDVAGMLRSFQYAAATVFVTRVVNRMVRAEEAAALEPWTRLWEQWTSSAFVRAYLETTAGAGLLPAAKDELEVLLTGDMLEKAVYELGYELNNRPDWIWIPIRGISQLVERAAHP
jgi:maltose alpha-D-glucosyltransferase/alpha-amylase